MEYRVKVITLTDPDGERLPVVVEKTSGIPQIEINQFLLRKRRGVVSFNTVIKEANVLILFLDWLSSNGRFLDRLSLDTIGAKDIYGLWEILRKSKSMNNLKAVSGSVHMYRWKVIQKFLKHIFGSEILKENYRSKDFSNYVAKRDQLEAEFKSLNYQVIQSRKRGLSPNVVEKVLNISREGSINNPWIKRDKLRNELIFDFLIFLGIRASELLKVEVQDLNLNSNLPTLIIKRIEDDPNDPRKYEPRVKTLGRILDINHDISLKLSRYLKQRRNIKDGKKSKYLFLAHTSGKPMTYIALSKLVSRIEESCIDLQGEQLSAHSFRRSWNDRFRASGEQLGIEEESITQSQNYLQGRSLDSPEAYKYASRHIEKSARRVLIEMQKRLLDEVK